MTNLNRPLPLDTQNRSSELYSRRDRTAATDLSTSTKSLNVSNSDRIDFQKSLKSSIERRERLASFGSASTNASQKESESSAVFGMSFAPLEFRSSVDGNLESLADERLALDWHHGNQHIEARSGIAPSPLSINELQVWMHDADENADVGLWEFEIETSDQYSIALKLERQQNGDWLCDVGTSLATDSALINMLQHRGVTLTVGLYS